MVECRIRELMPEDYEAAIALWQKTPGMGLSDADSQENIVGFLIRNKGMSFVAEFGNELIGTILCGHDGRRGFIYHLAVHNDQRKRGIGRTLVERCLTKLKEAGITKCHLFVMADNGQGMDFWDHIGFHKREDIHIYSKNVSH
ncbi:GNAT family N-acetyltransferase [Sporomusa sp.]|uniref:GNAT family N-acetyltransferase n=1 Tax=Sporomusa sp. TaxID=2078658 RepID=UPI002B9414B8|nr:GNAT family N-acetyltransferase [Sporomusa sp.]HWR44139.1 GNAT family N-acetyltransferase [Sporomusa sp.]